MKVTSFSRRSLLVAIAGFAFLAFHAGTRVAEAVYYMEICTGVGPSCPAGNNADDGGGCMTCQVTGNTKACVAYYVPYGCGGAHVCSGACGGPGGTPCSVTMASQC